ncbi:hypothetical protein LF887_15195 [Chryseobacterium sp. MEBOG06]|uniref:hypothetical protein n=1 Tax=Chryseobacterium sp. MEBOG06 TaxID=2879938 RepID=UPI001F271B80|nr:hypothetical protein [Chryseobacterium sp. MEBOG06]UKB82349.1 hypothetical protein LF887_15195 [Chryseobacterium sp. MEBOG06]
MGGSLSNAGLPTHTRQKIKTYDKICVFQKARRPQRIVHPIVTRHDTLCDKAGLEKEDCRKAEQHEIKTAWDSTISVIEVLVYLAHR